MFAGCLCLLIVLSQARQNALLMNTNALVREASLFSGHDLGVRTDSMNFWNWQWHTLRDEERFGCIHKAVVQQQRCRTRWQTHRGFVEFICLLPIEKGCCWFAIALQPQADKSPRTVR